MPQIRKIAQPRTRISARYSARVPFRLGASSSRAPAFTSPYPSMDSKDDGNRLFWASRRSGGGGRRGRRFRTENHYHHHDHHRQHSSFCRSRISLLAAVCAGGLCTSILRWRHRRACRLSRRFGADWSDRRRRDRQQHHPPCRTDRLHDVAIAAHSRRDRAPLRRAGCRGGLSRRARPRAHRHTRRGLARGNGSCRRDHRGGDRVDAHSALCPARCRTGHCRASVACHGGAEPTFRRFKRACRADLSDPNATAARSSTRSVMGAMRGPACCGRPSAREGFLSFAG